MQKNGWKGAVWDSARHAVSGKYRSSQFCNDQDADGYSQNEGTLDALIRPLQVLSSDAETHSVQTANEPSPDGELDTVRISSPDDPSQSQPRQRSVGTPGVSVEHSSRRRSARLAGAHLPQDSSTATSLRRSVRLNFRRA